MSAAEEEFALHCRVNGLKPEREYRFDGTRRWRCDFAWPERLLAVEIEGGVWSGGRHTTGKGFSADCEKYNALALRGWRLLRFTPDMVKSGLAIQQVKDALRAAA